MAKRLKFWAIATIARVQTNPIPPPYRKTLSPADVTLT